ncbi:MAG: hypothetical protein H0W09_00145 [Solirubrobacterales bacterium]|nr:hypothetical protein [Solirubrobacterales bacterium]
MIARATYTAGRQRRESSRPSGKRRKRSGAGGNDRHSEAERRDAGREREKLQLMVLYADAESFTLMTPQGHMFAGWITFSALEVDGETVAQAQVLMRASDPIFELGLTLGGHKQEDRFWNQTMTALATHFGHEAEVDTQVVCVDRKRQWSKWRNVWHSSAIRSTLYTMGAPGRALKRLLRRDRAVA